MNKRLSSKKKILSGDKLIYLSAALLTIAFHLSLLLLFKKDNLVEQKKQREGGAISMVCINSSSNSARNKLMNNIFIYGNPSMMTKADDERGYAAILKKISKPFTNSQPDITAYNIFDDDSDLKPAGPNLNFHSKIDERSYTRHLTPADSMANRMPAAAKQKSAISEDSFPRVLDQKDHEISGFFSNIKSVREKLKVTVPRNITLFAIEESGQDLVPRLKLVESSGVFELDQLAMRNFLANYDEHLKEKIKLGGLSYLKIEWRKGVYSNDSD